MIQIKPLIEHYSSCPHCQTSLTPNQMLWQGMHVCVESRCPSCNANIIEDLKVGHAVSYPFQVDVDKSLVFGSNICKNWLGKPLLTSLQNPQTESVNITKEVLKINDKVIILNCIDYLYGHCLLKLLNAQKYLDKNPEYGLVIIIQKFLRWMIPDGVSEVWTVDIPLRKGQCYFPNIDAFIKQELNNFSEVYLSEAYSHPSQFDITRFTKIAKHNFNAQEYRITFIWREDRIWCNEFLARVLKKLNLTYLGLPLQNRKIIKLFQMIRSRFPTAKFTVAGLGKRTKFPDWIEDMRVENFDEEKERASCQLYSESRLIIGVHGSNMLLPSGHAGMTINLMPKYRWGNFAQDILYQENDSRLASFFYRYLPIQINLAILAFIATSMIFHMAEYKLVMTADKAINKYSI